MSDSLTNSTGAVAAAGFAFGTFLRAGSGGAGFPGSSSSASISACRDSAATFAAVAAAVAAAAAAAAPAALAAFDTSGLSGPVSSANIFAYLDGLVAFFAALFTLATGTGAVAASDGFFTGPFCTDGAALIITPNPAGPLHGLRGGGGLLFATLLFLRPNPAFVIAADRISPPVVGASSSASESIWR